MIDVDLYVLVWTKNQSIRLMIGYTTLTSFQIRIPIDDLNSSLIQPFVRVRDQYDCTTEINLSLIFLQMDLSETLSLLTTIKSTVVNSDYRIVMNTSNSLIEILYGGYQNDICQVLTSFSQILNILAEENLQSAIEDNISPVKISVSTLNQEYFRVRTYREDPFNRFIFCR